MKSIIIALCCVIMAFSSTAQTGKLNVLVDERMELLTTIQYLSGYPVLTQAPLNYKQDIDNYFKDFKEHKAVLLNKAIYRRFFAFDAPPTYIYYFSFPGFKQVAPFSRDDAETFGFNEHKDTLTMLLNEFRDFYDKTQFHKFYTAHKAFYDSLTRPVKQLLATTDVIKVMEDHYGQKNKQYNIVLTPLLNDGGYGPQVKTAGGNALYAVIGPKYTSKEFPEFDLDMLMSEYVIHEFSHSFCNPLIAKHMQQMEKDSCLYNAVSAAMEEQGYGRWSSVLYEYLVRANEIVLTEKVLGKERADAAYEDMIKNGWVHLEGLVPIIKHYTADRKKQRTQASIMPLVISYFHRKASNCK